MPEMRIEQTHVDSELVENETKMEEKLLLLQTMKC